MKAIDNEMQAIRTETMREAETQKSRLVEHAQKASAQLLADGKLQVDQLWESVRAELRQELGRKITERAEEVIHDRLTGDERARIRREFSMQLERHQS